MADYWFNVGIVAFLALAIGITVLVFLCSEGGGKAGMIAICGITMGGVIAIIVVAGWRLHNTESGKQILKTWESEIDGGLERSIAVYDAQGDLLKTYTGRFDVTHDWTRIIFDDEEGNRHVIYPGVSTIVIDEK